jgi:hypothetical protein
VERARVTRRLAVFALLGALGFASGYALAEALPASDDTPTEHHDGERDTNTNDTNTNDTNDDTDGTDPGGSTP